MSEQREAEVFGVAEPWDVVYVAGASRSGSTLVARLLGLTPGWVNLGEIRYVWERGLRDNHRCECGHPFRDCPFWTQVLTEAFGSDSMRSTQEIRSTAEEGERFLQTRRGLLAAARRREPSRWARQAGQFADAVDRLYHALRDVTGSRVVVDSSKAATYGLLLAGLGWLRLHTIHLVRDSRATIHSWQRVKSDGEGGHMPRRSTASGVAFWSSSNLLAEAVLPPGAASYQRIRYEDFVSDPVAAVTQVVRRVDPGAPPPRFVPSAVEFPPGHAPAGNPDLLRHGPVAIRLDDAWRTQLAPETARVVTAATAPLLLRYGYRLRP